jgi:hypothetical protein
VHYRAYPEPVGKLALGPNWEKVRHCIGSVAVKCSLSLFRTLKGKTGLRFLCSLLVSSFPILVGIFVMVITFTPLFFCVQGRIPETLKATSSPAPIDRQWQGTVADNVDGGNGGGDRSSTNGDVWVPRAVCGAVPPSSAFANQVQPP